ncbi:hypothetical protein B5C34_11190 [Pacificimonas flava]|uniref:DUF4105 domain-containing protein n=2 Tax=Pacificimonas TaxID=1960290 RepID=A0A219B6I4_9SPHN|nr:MULTISPECIES: hypothetical protein [Pacificimonas]MBZ6378767.1 hypothetical protein [Pacificimonas aurantium]OWV33970.1 hypothetical protein B5C34_11190 [Pacificimonas flava]
MLRKFVLAVQMRTFLAALVALCALVWSAPGAAQVTIAFWSQDTGEYFPHAFVTLRGHMKDGEVVDESYGFTVKTVSPLILLTDVAGKIDFTEPDYMANSDVWFELDIDDRQVERVRSLVTEWGDEGDNTYSLNNRNCVHFVAEAMRRSGLVVEPREELMKKPKSFTIHQMELNADEVNQLGMSAPDYWALLEKRDAGAMEAAQTSAGAEAASGSN